jgi:two-component system chemotaxis sensor kinase CheA
MGQIRAVSGRGSNAPMDDLLREFLAETNELVAALERDLVRLEQGPDDPALVQLIFRQFHNIKGTSGFLGLKRLEKLAHAAENVLGPIRDGARAEGSEIVAPVIEALDRIKALLAGLAAEGEEPHHDDGDLVDRLDRAAATITAAVPAAPDPQHANDAGAGGDSIRVNLQALERLMAVASELVLTRNELMQLLRGRPDHEFTASLQRLSGVTTELQEGVMKLRMQPIATACAKLPRLVRDIARDLGKKIDLKIEGGETEIDRQVLELMRDPLTHLVRNAADHGIETPQERRRQGKSDTGTIVVSAHHQGGTVVIELADDGHGIDGARVRQKAQALGLATAEQLAAMGDHEVYGFIFRPGFTTAAEVTRVSGRGVGLDVVRANLEKIGGAIELKSGAGRGTRFVVRIPLTLAIVPALILDCAGERYAIPQTAVAELVQAGGASEHRLERIRGGTLLRLRGGLVPVVPLQHVLALGERAVSEEPCFVAIVKVGTNRFGVLVDGVDDAEEIVVKPLPAALRGNPVFSGTTIRGDGSITMILDPNGLAAAVGAVDEVEDKAKVAALPDVARERRVGVLLFRAGSDAPKALPLELIARIEEVPIDKIEYSDGRAVIAYRGQVMPLVTLDSRASLSGTGRRPVLVFLNEGRYAGIVADEILDITNSVLEIDRDENRPGIVGTAVIAGKITDVIDAGHYLLPAWLGARSAA